MKKTKIPAVVFAVVAAVVCSAPSQAPGGGFARFVNPYEEIDWETVNYFDANLHTHTTYSDGNYDPHQAIDKYHELEYDILALTDHDTHHHEARPRSLYPWTELNDIYIDIREETHSRFDVTFGERANEEWQDRDPDRLGMLSVEGSELSAGHHIGSYMSDYAGASADEHTSFREVGERDGLAMFFHPGRYDWTPEQYVAFYETYEHVIGQEIFNQVDRYPMDREKWDRILHRLLPDRPVWGFANDDTHGTDHFGRNRNVFLLDELTLENVRHAMIGGHLYMFVPKARGDRADIRIRGVESNGRTIRLHVKGEVDAIGWKTHDPGENATRMIHTGPEIAITDVPEAATFVRVVIESEAGRTYTQPFAIVRP